METKDILLTAKNIHKSFGATKALVDVTMTIHKGEIHGLIGENGSGKSTLSSIIAGTQSKDGGEIIYHGAPYEPGNLFDAINAGISMVGQEQNTLGELSAASNIYIGAEKTFSKRGLLIDVKRMEAAAARHLQEYSLDHIHPGELLRNLNFEERKLIEIARAMYTKPDLLIVDETSTTLGKNGRDLLYRILNQLREEGRSILFISHDVDEILEMCDVVTVLRDGRLVDTVEADSIDSHKVKQLMVGREVGDNYYREDFNKRLTDQVALQLEHIHAKELEDISLKVHYGEILGIGGLTDCGMHSVGKVLFGLIKPAKGKVIKDKVVEIKNSSTALKNRLAYVSKNRDREALLLNASIKDNICLASLKRLSRFGLISKGREKQFTNQWAKKLSIKMADINQNVRYLSGGNKQKVAVSKWLGTDADVYIFDCPTRGIDVGVQEDIYKLLKELRNEGKAIIMISEELPELIGMSDEIIIMKNFKISGRFSRNPGISEKTLIDYII